MELETSLTVTHISLVITAVNVFIRYQNTKYVVVVVVVHILLRFDVSDAEANTMHS